MNYALFATIGSIGMGVIYGINGDKEASYMFMIIANIWAAAHFSQKARK